ITAPLDLVYSHFQPPPGPFYEELLLDSVPERLPSRLPPPGTARLAGCLGRFIGDGNSGIVFELDTLQLDGAPPAQGTVPRLVVKIARSNRLAALARESWFYDEMECLQGSSIARCYGWFEVELSSGQIVPAWSEHPAEDPRDRDHALDLDRTVHPDQLKRNTRRDILSVLVLEMLGDRMPLSRLSSDDKSDIMSLHEDVSHLGLAFSDDARRQNTLRAPQEKPYLPSEVSPFTHRTHAWRMIDFEFGVKANYTAIQLSLSYKGRVRRMFEDAEEEGAEDEIPATFPEDRRTSELLQYA
ncbi:hypothetical protein BV25DRAFT_1828045, partial [Artomyces pyxidatus]